MRAVVDVQHLYRPKKPADRGAVYTLADGTHTDEATATLIYAASLRSYLEARGATVLANDPRHGILVGPYSVRHAAANAWRPHLYLACHLNAGRGSYALVEYMSLSQAKPLASGIGQALAAVFPEIMEHRTNALSSTDRGAVCIERVASPSIAVLLEPFFGDNPTQQRLLAATELHRVGQVVGDAIAHWWHGRHPA
jgi:N-acetylmuramoyl-L-alanine amidase